MLNGTVVTAFDEAITILCISLLERSSLHRIFLILHVLKLTRGTHTKLSSKVARNGWRLTRSDVYFSTQFLKTLEYRADIFPKSRHVITAKGTTGEKIRREQCVP